MLKVSQTISTVAITVPILQERQLPSLDAWLRSILWDLQLPGRGQDLTAAEIRRLEIHRLKARLPLSNGDVKIVQGVRDVFEILDSPTPSPDGTTRESKGKIVLIGRNLTDKDFEESFNQTVGLS